MLIGHPGLHPGLMMIHREDDRPSSSSSSMDRSVVEFAKSDRVKHLRRMSLYHQTDYSGYQGIISSRSMRRGSDGIAGGGIYFAASASETEGKAHSKGVILEVVVAVGHIMTVSSSKSDVTFSSLQKDGYDSVMITGRPSGVEYVVYNSDQVLSVRRIK